MKYQIIPVTPYQQNCSLVICQSSLQAALIDPGGDRDILATAIQDQGVTLQYILLTHGHLDHVGAAMALAQQFKVPILGPHRADQFWLDNLPEQCKAFGFPLSAAFTPDRWLNDGDQLLIGQQRLEVIHCPGHTPGHVVFFSASARLAWVGDVLFKGSIGRTDFPQGDYDTLINSIKQKLWPLGEGVVFIPGHGPCSSFGAEMRTNPYLGDR